MRKITLTGILLFVLAIAFSSTALAQNKPKTGPKLPTFMAGDNQLVDKPVDGDLMISGGQIKIVSNVNGDVYVAGGQINIDGAVKGNLIVAGGNVVISGKVTKNVIVGGGTVKFDEQSDIGGYVLAGAGKIDLMGRFAGPVKIGAGDMTVGEKAVIGGDLEADVSKSIVASTAKIGGEKKVQIHETKQQDVSQNQWRQLGYVKDVFSFLSKLVVLLVLVKLCGVKLRQAAAANSFWSSIGLGLVVLIITPFVALILMITIIGMPLSAILMVIYAVSLYLSGIVASIAVGDFIAEKGYLKTSNHYFQGTIGLIIVTLLSLIPLAGILVKFIVLLIGLGTIYKKMQMHLAVK